MKINYSKPTDTPLGGHLSILQKINFLEEGSEVQFRMENNVFQKLIDCPNYSVLSSKPNIGFAANALNLFVENPKKKFIGSRPKFFLDT